MLWGVNCNKSHQPLNVSMPLNIGRVHPQLTRDHNIQHKIRFLCFRCLRESREMQLLYNFCFRRSLRKSTLSSIQRTEINWFASRTSSHGRYWICYNIPVNRMQQTYIFLWILSDQSVGTITFTVFIDPITGWRHLSPREEGDWWLAAFPRAYGGMLQTAEEEGGEGVRSERAGEFSVGRWEGN